MPYLTGCGGPYGADRKSVGDGEERWLTLGVGRSREQSDEESTEEGVQRGPGQQPTVRRHSIILQTLATEVRRGSVASL